MKKSFYSIGSIIILLFAALIFVLIPAVSGAGDAVRYPDYGSYNGRPVRFEENSDFYNAVSESVIMNSRELILTVNMLRHSIHRFFHRHFKML